MSMVRNAYEIVRQQQAEKRPPIEHLDADIFSCLGPKSKTLVEISGRANSGKSMLLQQLVARCVLPTYFGGKYAEVIYIDAGHHFNIRRYMDYGRSLIGQSRDSIGHKEDDAELRRSFESVHLLECFDADAFEAALDEVENLLWTNGNIGLLAIDHLEAFYWANTRERPLRMMTHYTQLCKRLRKLCHAHNIVCAYTVTSGYIAAKRKGQLGTPSTSAPAPKAPSNADYRLELKLLSGGQRTLNGRVITITREGIRLRPAVVN